MCQLKPEKCIQEYTGKFILLYFNNKPFHWFSIVEISSIKVLILCSFQFKKSRMIESTLLCRPRSGGEQVNITQNQVSKRSLHTHDHGSIIHNHQEVGAAEWQINGWMDLQKKKRIYTCNWRLFNLRKEILTNTAIWMNLEDMMISEISQSKKDKYHMVLLIRANQSSQIHRDRK